MTEEEFDKKRNEKIEEFYARKEREYTVRPYQALGFDAFCGQAARAANRHRRAVAHREYLADLRIRAYMAIERTYDVTTPKSLKDDAGIIKEEWIDDIFSEYGEYRSWPSIPHQDVTNKMLKNFMFFFPDKCDNIMHSCIADRTSSSKTNKEVYSDLVYWETAPNYDLTEFNHDFGNRRDPSLIIEVVDEDESVIEAQKTASKLLTAIPTLREIFLYEFTTKTWMRRLKGHKWENGNFSPMLNTELDILNSNDYRKVDRLAIERIRKAIMAE